MSKPTDGLTRCDCGSKYWDARTQWFPNGDAPELYSEVTWVCHSCSEKYRPGETLD